MGEIRYGTVSSTDPGRMTARVVFQDKDDMPSWDLAVIVPNTLRNKDYQLPDVGEKVICVFLDNGKSQGFILGAVYDQSNPPPKNNPDVRGINFADGTFIEYNRNTHTLNINCIGDININGKAINLN